LLGHHYRQVWEWEPAELDAAAGLAERLSLAAHASDSPETGQHAAFAAALADDLDTPRAIEVLTTVSGAPLRELGAVIGLELTGAGE
jgi:L-cysteine:1D-myo-inositol 2-amino-2-deoxy-alpha-D-glucopyranoside ligase